jgi:hypothetical protein
MKRASQFVFRSGRLVSVLAPIIAVVLYPRARWLFGFAAVGVALLLFIILTTKKPTAPDVAALAERLLSGSSGQWDVDDYGHINPKDPQVRELWERTMEVGGLPEEWPGLDEEKKNQIRDIIRSLKQLGVTSE